MTIETKAREWAEKEAKAVMNDPAMISLKTMFERAYLAGAAEAVRWVPVSERLPEMEKKKAFWEEEQEWYEWEEANVLAIDPEKGIVKSRYSPTNKWSEVSSISSSSINPTHWMPLPPHPEKEQL